MAIDCTIYYRDGILGHQFNTRLESFAHAIHIHSSLFMNSILKKGKTRIENRTKTRVSEHSCLCPETSTKYYVHEFYLRVSHYCIRDH
jgi:hypothetical protein